MIRAFTENDLSKVMSLWLETNISAHSFIAAEYWRENFETVRRMLPSATIHVDERGGKIVGFAGLEGGYIAGIFVSGAEQSNGIGGALLERCKSDHHTLSLCVYERNRRAIDFYIRNGFNVIETRSDENTGERELVMEWHG